MYVPPKDRKKVIQEVYRVLKSNGEFHIWDLEIPKKSSDSRRFYGAHFEIDIGKEVLYTGYATHSDREQNIETYMDLCKEIGFDVRDKSIMEENFYIKLIKNL